MASFTDAVGGNPTNASDLNQLVDALNGNTGAQVSVQAPNTTSYAISGVYSAAPASDQPVIRVIVSGDTIGRVAMYLRSDGYGGLRAGGNGTSTAANFYGQSSGWVIPQSLTIQTNLTVQGSSSLAGATLSGTLTVAGAVALNGGGTVSGNNIMQGISTARIYVQSTAPSSPQTGDIWIDTSINLS